MAKKYHWVCTLTKPDKSRAFVGRHNGKGKARNNARTLATDAGEDWNTMDEQMVEVYGPAPRTFQGNDNPGEDHP